MPLFNFHYIAGFDLGTYKLRILKDNKLVCNERTSLVMEPDTHRILIIGDEVYKHELGELKITNPVNYTLADFEAGEQLVHQMIKRYIPEEQRLLLPKSINAFAAIPGHASEVDLRAYRDSMEHMNASDIHLVYSNTAAAIGMKLVPEKRHFILIEFSASKMEVSFFYDGQPIKKGVVRMGTLKMEATIANYMKRKYNIKPTEEHLWGILQNFTSGNDKTVAIQALKLTMNEINDLLNPFFFFYDELLLGLTDILTAEQRAKIFGGGIYFSGGGSYFHAICKRMASPLKLPYHIGTAPELDVINGIREVIKDTQKFKAYIFK